MLHIHLRSWRHHKKLTLRKVADMIGSKENTLSGWETGSRGVDLDDIKKLADVYGVHPAALLFSPSDTQHFETLREVLELINSMDGSARDVWLAMGRQLCNRSD